MKKVLLLLAVLALAPVAFGAIAGSAHDFSDGVGQDAAWNTNDQICQPCHVPHALAAAESGAPLWNHTLTTFSITPYNSTTLTDQGRTASVPTGLTKLCLSCHDGSVGLDAFGGVATGTAITGSALLNTLATSHPVGIVYDTAASADGDIPTADASINALLDGGAGGTVECTSCHDVHNGADQDSLLVMDNTNSVLCVTCHSK